MRDVYTFSAALDNQYPRPIDRAVGPERLHRQASIG